MPTTGPRSVPALVPAAGDDEEQLVAVDDAAQVIDHHHAIAVAIEGDADMRAHARHRELQQFRGGGAAAVVDIAAVGRAADRHDLGAQIREHPRRDLVAGAVGAVDDDLEARQIMPAGSTPAQNSW